MSEEKSTAISKQKMFVPENVNDGKHMLNAFAAKNAELFGDGARAVVELKKMVDHMDEIENAYKEW
eukprot:5288902-Ditylum_brightwellii.AAC.1